jgi:hypothetical protein
VTNTAPANGTAVTGTTVALTWSAAAGATGYDVYLGTSPNPTTTVATNLTGTTYIYTITATASTTFYWYVVPKNASGAATGCSSSVTSFSFSVMAPPPSPAVRLYCSINPASVEIALPNSAVQLTAEVRLTTGIAPVLQSVQWSGIAGPSGYQFSSPNTLATAVQNLVYGTYVFKCNVQDTAGRKDSAYAVVSVYDPARTQQELILRDQRWQETGFSSFIQIDLYQYIPPGIPIREVQFRTDCDTAFRPFQNSQTANYGYGLSYFESKIWLYIWNCYCGLDICSLIDDTPDIRIVY